MYFVSFNRNDFADILSDPKLLRRKRLEASRGEPPYEPDSRQIWVCWDDDALAKDLLPRLVVVADKDLEEFFAWSATFIQSFRPLTAFMRVISWSVYDVTKGNPWEHNREYENVSESLLAGAALGEAMVSSTGRPFLESVPLAVFEFTYASAIGKALLSGQRPLVVRRASQGWQFVRHLTEQPVKRSMPESVKDIWTIILRLCDVEGFDTDRSPRFERIFEACLQIRRNGTISNHSWESLSGDANSFSIEDVVGFTKERRVEMFEGTAFHLINRSRDQFTASFLVGYLASLVSGGSIEHAHLISPIQEALPTAMIWYGVCAGLHPNTRVLSDYNSLGLRLVRTMNRREGLLSVPACDISIEELEVLFRADPRARNFRQTNNSFLRVEIAPTITTAVRWPLKPNAGNQLNLFGSDDKRMVPEQDKVSDLVAVLRKSLSMAESLSDDSSLPPPQQPKSKRRQK